MKPNQRFQQAFGPVPESFSHRVHFALRQTEKEEQPVKRFSIRTAVIAVLLVALVTAAVAATLSGTMDVFAHLYGERFTSRLEESQLAPGGQSITLNGAVYTLGDTVVLPAQDKLNFYAAGSITPAEGENLVLMAWDEYTVNDPVGDAMYYGELYPAAPEGTPTYAELAAQKGLSFVRQVTCIPNGILDASGKPIANTTATTVIPQLDGSIQFTVEIPMETALPQQESYQMSLCVITQDVDLTGSPVENTRKTADWIITVQPE